jgi:hypothetical protein
MWKGEWEVSSYASVQLIWSAFIPNGGIGFGIVDLRFDYSKRRILARVCDVDAMAR